MTDLPTLSPNNDNISWIAYYDVSEFVSNSNFVPEDLNNPSRQKDWSYTTMELSSSMNTP